MKSEKMNILLADDDTDDCSFFQEVIGKIFFDSKLFIVNDGEQLMKYLNSESTILPDVLFLDLNMHRKNGFECLNEIKASSNLKNLPVIVFSTSFDQDRVDMLYTSGAQYFMRKPAQFQHLKIAIHQALTFITNDIKASGLSLGKGILGNVPQPDKNKFILSDQGLKSI